VDDVGVVPNDMKHWSINLYVPYVMISTYQCLIGSLYTFMGAGADPLSCTHHAALLSRVLIYTYGILY